MMPRDGAHWRGAPSAIDVSQRASSAAIVGSSPASRARTAPSWSSSRFSASC